MLSYRKTQIPDTIAAIDKAYANDPFLCLKLREAALEYAMSNRSLRFSLIYVEVIREQSKKRKGKRNSTPREIFDIYLWKQEIDLIKESVDFECGRRNFVIQELYGQPAILFDRSWSRDLIVTLPKTIPVRMGKDQSVENLDSRFWIGQEAVLFLPDYLRNKNKADIQIANKFHEVSLEEKQRPGFLRRFPPKHLIITLLFVVCSLVSFGLYTYYRSAEKEKLELASRWKNWRIGNPGLILRTRWEDKKLFFELHTECLRTKRCHGDFLLHLKTKQGEKLKTIRVANDYLFSTHFGEVFEYSIETQTKGDNVIVEEIPSWALSECIDGTFSRSSGSGTCSHHGGVRRRL